MVERGGGRREAGKGWIRKMRKRKGRGRVRVKVRRGGEGAGEREVGGEK